MTIDFHARDDRYVSYILLGDFDPDDVTRATGLTPTRVGRKGDRVVENPPSAHRLPQPIWVMDSGLAQSDEFHQHLEALFDRLRPGWPALCALGREHVAQVQAAIYCRSAQGPRVEIAPNASAALVELNALMDFDIYAVPEDEEDDPPDS